MLRSEALAVPRRPGHGDCQAVGFHPEVGGVARARQVGQARRGLGWGRWRHRERVALSTEGGEFADVPGFDVLVSVRDGMVVSGGGRGGEGWGGGGLATATAAVVVAVAASRLW